MQFDMAPNNVFDIISESRNIIEAHFRHFLTLFLIFLLPLFSSFLLSLTHLQQHPTSLFFPLFYSLFTLVFSNCGLISITYSVFHFSYGQPANLQSAIKSISTSFLPLLATTIVSQVIIFFISLFYGLLLVLAIHAAKVLHVTISYSPPYLIAFFVALPLLLVLIYLQVNWTLVPVIVVVESCWGLESLRRSARLICGMKGVALSSFFFYGFSMGFVVWATLALTTHTNEIAGNWVVVVCSWVLIVMQSFYLAMFMLSNIAVNTVLYRYCKANHGDELVEGFGKDAVSSLPFHDGKVSNAV